jgi:hypothetical protein
MIETTPSPASGPDAPPAAPGVTYGVRTNALDQLCDDLQRAVAHGRQLLDHPGVVRGRADDAGDETLRHAVVAFATRWEWCLQALVDDTAALLGDLRAAAQVYDEVERTSVTAAHPVLSRRG